MRLRHLALVALFGVLFVGSIGCRRWRSRDDGYRNDPLFQRRDDFQPPPGFAPDPRALPPGGPGAPEVLTPQPYPRDNGPTAPGMPPNSSGYFRYPGSGGIHPAEHWQTSPPLFQRSTAEPPLARATPLTPPPKPRVDVIPPGLLEPKVTEGAATIPPVTDADNSPTLPVGIDVFGEPKSKIATGRRPDPEGLDWLRSSKYRTVLNLRRRGSDDSADREQIEKRGLKYLSIELSPATLTKEVVEEFNKIVADSINLPLFVYDKDGTLAGSMWYLHFRTAEKMPDDLARMKAGSYGLKEKGNSEQTAYWAAIQLLIAEKPE